MIEQLQDERLPDGVQIVKFEDHVLLASFSKTEASMAPEIEFSVEIGSDCTFSMFKHGIQLPINIVSHISKSAKISSISALLNICAFLKNWDREEVKTSQLESVLALMEKAIKEAAVEESDTYQKWSFHLEQLQLSLKKKKARKYTPELLAMSMMWKNTSPALYRQLLEEDILCLPSVSYLQRLQSAFNFTTGFDASTKKYLKARVSTLKEYEKIMVCMIDEVHTLQRIEYQSGRLFGMKEDTASKTVLSVMLKSIAGNYEDVVALFPVSNLNSKMLKEIFDLVYPTLINIEIIVVAMSSDNYTANRKFFKDELCGGELKPFITLNSNGHLITPDSSRRRGDDNLITDEKVDSDILNHGRDDSENECKVFLLFDATHNFKNVFNCFLNKGSFVCPSFEVSGISSCVIHFLCKSVLHRILSHMLLIHLGNLQI